MPIERVVISRGEGIFPLASQTSPYAVRTQLVAIYLPFIYHLSRVPIAIYIYHLSRLSVVFSPGDGSIPPPPPGARRQYLLRQRSQDESKTACKYTKSLSPLLHPALKLGTAVIGKLRTAVPLSGVMATIP